MPPLTPTLASEITGATVTFSPKPISGTTALFSSDSGAQDLLSDSHAASKAGPGTANALPAFVGAINPSDNSLTPLLLATDGARGDSKITGTKSDKTSAISIGEAHITKQGFGSGLGKSTASYTFTSLANTIVAIKLSAMQTVNVFTSKVGETAIGSSSVAWTITDGTTFTPFVVGPFDLNQSASVTDGHSFSSTRSGVFTYTFAPIAAGPHTLSFTETTGADVTAAAPVPEPAMLGLIGAGLGGLACVRRRRG